MKRILDIRKTQFVELDVTLDSCPYFQALNILSPMFCDTYCMGSFA